MPQLQVPRGQQGALARLVSISAERFDALVAALASLTPSIAISDLAARAAEVAGADPEETEEILSLASTLYVMRDLDGIDVDDLSEAVCDAAANTDDPALRLDEAKRQLLKTRIAKLIALDRPLGITAKALNVFADTDKLFCNARVVTDLRPIFLPGGGHDPQAGAAVVAHTLRISYHQGGGGLKHFYVVLEAEDVRRLGRLLDRALDKERSIRAVAEKGGLECLTFREE